MRGRIVSEWKKDGASLKLNVVIPANTTAMVYVPAGDVNAVTEGGKPAGNSEGVKFLRMEANAAVFSIGSGSYTFEAK